MEEDVPFIPFGGGGAVIMPENIADYIRNEDKIPLAFAVSLYTNPIQVLGDWSMVDGSFKKRIAAWKNGNQCIIGCRGTQLDSADLEDDKVIAGYGANYCDLSIVQLADQLISNLEGVEFFIFAGHSLGGTSAFCLCAKYANSRCVAFNPGAAPSNPVLSGPGNRANVYHIFGDVISSHMSDQAANVLRIKLPAIGVGGSAAHATSQLTNHARYTIASAQEEENAFKKWVKGTLNFVGKLLSFFGYIRKHYHPIPGTV
jgi:pimeloyl-ACP methyl ester carboxylesterase